MKWHPVMIRWCISIYLKSPGAYERLRNSGFLKLLHKKTLSKYANYTEPKWINFDVVKHIGLVYSKQIGSIVGFCDMGDMNNELEDFKNRIENKEEDNWISNLRVTS